MLSTVSHIVLTYYRTDNTELQPWTETDKVVCTDINANMPYNNTRFIFNPIFIPIVDRNFVNQKVSDIAIHFQILQANILLLK